MSLPFFTNEVGYHERITNKYAQTTNRYPQNGTTDSYQRGFAVVDAYSRKPAIVHGNHVNATDYYRNGGFVVVDDPYVYRDRLFGGDTLFRDSTYEHFISVDHGPFNYIPSSTWEDNARSMAEVKALNRLQQHAAGLGSDLVQARQAVDMFADLVKRTASLIESVRHFNPEPFLTAMGLSRKQISKSRGTSFANLWLEYSYGWKPFVSDMFEAQQAVLHWLGKNLIVKATAKAAWSGDDHFPYGGATWKWSLKSEFRVKLLALVSSPLWANLNQLGLVNPAAIAWDVVPWSFVLDWFVPVQDVLQACTALVGLTPLGGFTTNRRDWVLSASQVVTYDGYSGIESSGQYQEIGADFSRNAYTQFPLPSLYANPNPYSTERALNAIALVKQLQR